MSDSEANECFDRSGRTEGDERSSQPRGPSDSRRSSKRRRSHSNSSESFPNDSSDSEVKRRRLGKSNTDIKELMNKVKVLTNVLLQNVVLPSQSIFKENFIENTASSTANDDTCITTLPAARGPSPEPLPGPSGLTTSAFQLHRPTVAVDTNAVEPRLLSLGVVNTVLKDPKILPAHPEHLKHLEFLQKFGDPCWKDVRYTDSLKAHCASPGFVDLEVNNELRQFLKGKDFVANSEKILAAICNGLITQRELLNEALQQFINWTASSQSILSADSIFDKISDLFQPTSKFHKTSEEIMQMVCGKRAEYIENRRERILIEIPNKNLREGLRKIPPSSRHLFDEGLLCSYIQSTGGMDKWVRPWFSADRVTSKPKHTSKLNKPGSTRDFTNQPFRSRDEESRPNRSFAGSSKQLDSKRAKKPFKKNGHPGKKQFDK